MPQIDPVQTALNFYLKHVFGIPTNTDNLWNSYFAKHHLESVADIKIY